MKGKKWLIVLIIALSVVAIGLAIWYFVSKGGQVSADSVEQSYLSPDTGISVSVSDGVDEVKAGDIVNYQIDFNYEGNKITNQLKKNQIDTRLLFVGMNRQPSLEKHGCNMNGQYEITDNLTKNGLYLPSGSNLTKKQIEYVCKVIKDYRK